MVSHPDRHSHYTAYHGEIKLPSPGQGTIATQAASCRTMRVLGGAVALYSSVPDL